MDEGFDFSLHSYFLFLSNDLTIQVFSGPEAEQEEWTRLFERLKSVSREIKLYIKIGC